MCSPQRAAAFAIYLLFPLREAISWIALYDLLVSCLARLIVWVGMLSTGFTAWLIRALPPRWFVALVARSVTLPHHRFLVPLLVTIVLDWIVTSLASAPTGHVEYEKWERLIWNYQDVLILLDSTPALTVPAALKTVLKQFFFVHPLPAIANLASFAWFVHWATSFYFSTH